MKEKLNNEISLYSLQGITIATFLGGPLGASILVKHNYDQLGERSNGIYSIIIGIIATIILFVLVIMFTENISDRITQRMIPIIYTSLIYIGINKLLGKRLIEYEKNGNKFKSNWFAGGVGLICIIPMLGGFMLMDKLNPSRIKYDTLMQKFSENEAKALDVYNGFDSKGIIQRNSEFNKTSLPLWNENLAILDSIDQSKLSNMEIRTLNSKLRKYCNLRINELEIYRNNFTGSILGVDDKIERINLEIELLLNELNE